MDQGENHSARTIDAHIDRESAKAEQGKLLIKRAHRRMPVTDGFVIQLLDASGQPEVFVQGYNLSPKGLGVISKHPIEAETQVQVQVEHAGDEEPWISGRVIHCTMTVGGFKIGLQFDELIEIEES